MGRQCELHVCTSAVHLFSGLEQPTLCFLSAAGPLNVFALLETDHMRKGEDWTEVHKD